MRALGLIIAAILVPAGMAAADAAREFKDKIEPLLQDYCYDCHGDGAKKGDISLDEFKDLSSHLSNHDLWLRVWRNARTHLMPPVDEDFQPSPEERRFLTSWITSLSCSLLIGSLLGVMFRSSATTELAFLEFQIDSGRFASVVFS